MKKLLVLFLLLSASAGIYGQNIFDIDANLRLRTQADAKDFNADTDPFTFTEMRTRVNLGLYPGDNVSAFVQIQDSRVFGTEASTLSNSANLDLHQGYIYVKEMFGLPVDAKAGRMEAAYGNQRLIGTVGWSNVGRSFDGIVFSHMSEKYSLDLFRFEVREMLRAEDDDDMSMTGLWGGFDLDDMLNLQPFILFEHRIGGESMERFTLGFYSEGFSGGFFHETEFAYQAGEITLNTVKNDIAAMMAALNVGYHFDTDLKPVISAGVDYLSGDDDPGDDQYKVFNTLYATNHKFYGYMDYFINIPGNTFNRGLTDIHVKAAAAFSEKFTAGVNFHIFSASEPVVIGNEEYTDFGSEIDVTAKYLYNQNLNLQCGISAFMPGDALKFQGEDTAMWAYLMATFAM